MRDLAYATLEGLYMSKPTFLPGVRLSQLFFEEAVQPILAAEFPDVAYSAALIGPGSEVLGFDTPMSVDHDWGPRLLLFLDEADLASVGGKITEALGERLPYHYRGYPTGYTTHTSGTGTPLGSEMRPLPHRVQVESVPGYLERYLGWHPARELAAADWLTFPQQKLRSLTAGVVYHDAIGLVTILDRLAYYPDDVWLYLLAAQWRRIGEEEHLVGRAGFSGDELGATIIASRLVRDLMNVCFLMEKVYAPYPKWFGTAFAQLACAPRMLPLLGAIQSAGNWEARDRALAAAYVAVAGQHQAMGITDPIPVQPSHFFDRPFHVIWGQTFADAILEQIKDEQLRTIAGKGLLGGIDQVSDNTELLTNRSWRDVLVKLYEVDGA
jgi:hypothetical protein